MLKHKALHKVDNVLTVARVIHPTWHGKPFVPSGAAGKARGAGAAIEAI